MKVTIKRYKEDVKLSGLFAKAKTRYFVTCAVTFNEEEVAIIKDAHIEDVVIEEDVIHNKYTTPDNPLVLKTTFGHLLTGEKKFSGWYDYPVEAKNYENKLRTDILPRVKNYIEGSRFEKLEDTFEM